MLLFKTPRWDEAWSGLIAFAWIMAVILIGSWVLEVSHVIDPLPWAESITEFQQKKYWLPLDGFMGVHGRWTGPLGHNTRTGLAAALIFVIAVSRWTKSTIPLAAISGFVLLITSVRASYLAVVAGVAIVVLFSRRGILSRVPTWSRWVMLTGVIVVASVGFTVTGAGLTGRQNIWPAFVRLIPQSPWIGVGGSGIAKGEYIVAFREDAHNIFLDDLVRNGVLGFVFQMAVLGLGFVLCFIAASRGFAAPAAVLAVYLVASLTDVVNDWIQLSYAVVLILIGVTSAGTWLEDHQEVESGSPP
jgi:O-antigen ligase